MTVVFGNSGTGTDQELWIPPTGGGYVGSRYPNDSGADQHLTSVELISVSRTFSSRVVLGLFRNDGGLPGDFICEAALSSLAVGTNVFTLTECPTVYDGETIWGYIAFNGSLYLNNSTGPTAARYLGFSVSGGFTYDDYLFLGTVIDRVIPLGFVGGGTPISASVVDVDYSSVEPLSEGDPYLAVDYISVEPLSEGNPLVSVDYLTLEPLAEGNPTVSIAYLSLESLQPVPLELPVSTEPFPGFGNSTTPSIPQALDPFDSALPGLAFSVHKKPLFKTNINESASGNEVRTSFAEYPRWDFELTYEFLEDRSGAESSLKTIMGFFLSRRGSYDSWLFKDPDDYLSVLGPCGTSDGVTVEFPFCRTLGGFQEKVCQVDTANTIAVYADLDGEAHTLPANGSISAVVQTIAVTYPPSGGYGFISDLGVTRDGTPMTKIVGTPATLLQYAVNTGTGVYSFWSGGLDPSADIAIAYHRKVPPADYTVTLPNLIVFDSAPAIGTVYADFQFFFACRFMEDQLDFEKFMDKLWSLQECHFRSIIQ